MAEDNKKGITVKVDADLHAQIKEYIESRGMTMGDFITVMPVKKLCDRPSEMLMVLSQLWNTSKKLTLMLPL